MVWGHQTVPTSTRRPTFPAKKFRDALKKAYSDMSWVRSSIKEASDEYQGRRRAGTWTKNGSLRPFNPMNQVVTTYLPNLAAYSVGARIRTRGTASRAEAEMRQYLTNLHLEGMDYASTDRQVVLDMLLSPFGAMKLNLNLGAGQFKDPDRASDFGEIGAARVPPVDMLFDPDATAIKTCGWISDRYTANKQRLVESLTAFGMADKAKLVESLVPIGEGREEMPNRGLGGQPETETSVSDEVVLWDVVIFERDEVYVGTLGSLESGKDVWIVEPEPYQGHERGPYVIGSLMDVQDEPIGMSVADQMMELHYALQKSGEKAYRQIIKTKRVNAYKAHKRKDADAMKNGDDEEWQAVQDPDFVKQIVSGGLLPEFMPGISLFMQALNLASAVEQGSGRGKNEGSATQAAIQNQRVNVTFADMQERVMAMRRDVIRRIGFWIDELPMLESMRQQDTPFGAYQLVYSQNVRRSRYTDFSYDSDVVTASKLDPNTRLARLKGALESAAAMIPQVAQTGGDVAALVDVLATEHEVPALRDIYGTAARQTIVEKMREVEKTSTPEGAKPKAGLMDQVRSDLATSTPAGPSLVPGGG
jgi:hypothetical protein